MTEKYIPSIAEQLKAEIQLHSICCGPDFDEYGTAGDGWPRNNKALRDARAAISKARGQ